MHARIENSAVVEIIEPYTNEGGQLVPIEERFTPDLVATMLELPEGSPVTLGYIVSDTGEFAPPVIVTPAPDLDAQARAQRDALLTASDWTQLADIPTETQEKWGAYRQELRNVPQQKGFPKKIKWPEAPQ